MKRIIALLFVLLLCGCGTSHKTVFQGEPKSEAEAAYRAAVKTLESGSYEDSIKAFHAIKLKYPYATRWATLCDLRIADAYRESGEYSQAAVSYQAFIRTYPAHSDIAYATYQAANCYYEMMPSDFFILPDPWQRDRKSTSQAETALHLFLKRYPTDENAPKAQEQYEEVRRRLASHELYVAEYNFKHKAYQGTVNRLVGLLDTYPESAVVPKAHILLAHSYLKLKDPVSAKQVLTRLVEKYPDTEQAKDARDWIAKNTEVP
ncbi:MAG: outer membrane protein assembly factor BamD [Proteobacteria bacterium]|jgi:outer membrane protein assembly factor BamD|nr:outer membrane protein assembly factor BamD [Pseudomonadota bacterium]